MRAAYYSVIRRMDAEVLKEIIKYSRLPREHASFYNWHEKGVKESGIVNYFLDERNHKGIHDFVSFSVPKSDPPDAWIFEASGNKVALEITELVNRDAITAQIHDKPNYWEECERWASKPYFQDRLNERVQEKQEKCSNLFSSCVDVQLLMHTDEMWVESCYERHFEHGLKLAAHSFSKIWLMLSYSPRKQLCPVILL